MFDRNICAQVFAGALLAAVSVAPASAQSDYPSRNISIIVAVAAGSQADMFARLIGDQLSTRLGKPVIVENRPGGGQVVGGAAAAKAAPDGYTLFHGNLSGLIISPQLRNPQPYNTPKDFAPITMTFSGPSVLVVDPKLPIKDAKELIAYAKANPGKLNYGSHGAGSWFLHARLDGDVQRHYRHRHGAHPVQRRRSADGRLPVRTGAGRDLRSGQRACAC
jgi:tripartite-type tricarboxylate transporter receptor subunit TctC